MAITEQSVAEKATLHLFEAVGIELEYMIVDSTTLNVLPITDKLIYKLMNEYATEIERGRISYSNELALHVVELKTTAPEPSFNGLGKLFHEHISAINDHLISFKAHLLATAAHPWMNPYKEMRLWPHEHNPIYEAYHRIFNCTGHGWANLQSMHVNLPFANDEEFFLLHSAIRMILPLLPALAASSPILEGKSADKLDKRLDVYKNNQAKIPTITSKVIPEVSYSFDHYQKTILQPIYRDITPHDPEKILQCEWLNSRGAIARFDRSAIEIRVIDIQECPQADIAIAKACVHLLKKLISGKLAPQSKWLEFDHLTLVRLFSQCVASADQAIFDDEQYLSIFGITAPTSAKDIWHHLLRDFHDEEYSPALEIILKEGCLASRILKACDSSSGGAPIDKEKLKKVYSKLSQCLRENTMFLG